MPGFFAAQIRFLRAFSVSFMFLVIWLYLDFLKVKMTFGFITSCITKILEITNKKYKLYYKTIRN